MGRLPNIWQRDDPSWDKLSCPSQQRTTALSLFFSLVVAAAFVIHFATVWMTFGREGPEFGFALVS